MILLLSSSCCLEEFSKHDYDQLVENDGIHVEAYAARSLLNMSSNLKEFFLIQEPQQCAVSW